VINGALPFWLIAWGEKHVESGVAAIANSTVPIFTAVLALHYRPSERVSGSRLAGIVLGLAGVAVLTGLHPGGDLWAVAGTLAVVVASLSYARANLYTQQHLDGVSALAIASAATVTGFVVILPFGLLQLPDRVPSAGALGSVLVLAVVGTAFASIVLYRSLRLYGASRMALVTYLLPGFALFYGAVFLGERITAGALVGLALILGGVAFGSGLAGLGRRSVVAGTER
jgi:drug/metabolite transporter (DMT)-like permease